MEENREITLNKWGYIMPLVLLLLVVVVGVIFFSCGKTEEEYNGYYIFGVDASDTKVTYEKYSPKAKNGTDMVKEFLEQMQEEPTDIAMKKAVPDNVSIDEFTLQEGGELTLYLDAAYGNYTGVTEIIRRAAIVKTLCQIPDVDAVQFYVAGQPLTNSNSDTIGFMTADTFIDNTGGETVYRQKATFTMYFASSDGNKLVDVPVEITYDATIPLEELAIEQLMKGPDTIDGVEKKELKSTIPNNVTLNKVTVKNRTCYVDFSEEFLQKPEGISPEVAIYSVVNTLIELPDVNKVQFSINGEQVLLYNDTLHFGEVFSRNLDLVQ